MRSISSVAVKVGRGVPRGRIAPALGRPVLPPPPGEKEGGAVLFEEIEVRADDAPGPTHLVADDAPLFSEELLTGLRIARRIEVGEGIQECDAVDGVAGIGG